MQKLVLTIDDDPAVLGVINECLRPHTQVRIANNGQTGLELARQHPLPDLILLDVRLPDIRGFDVCLALKQDQRTAEIPVIFLSSHADQVNITHGFKLGAVDYVSKPVEPAILLARVQTHLRLGEASRLLSDQNAHLEVLVSERTRELETRSEELQLSRDLTILALGSIAETRDNETGNHIHRTRAYFKAMTGRLAPLHRYRNAITENQWSLMWKSSPLHDIGKVGIPDHILLKPGKLTAGEFVVMRQHAVIGRDSLALAETRSGSTCPSLVYAKEIAHAHHERWDGNGYPEGLSGEAIPLSARIMAVADVYDALISKRVYKPAWSHDKAIDEIRAWRGRHFDPSVVDCFLENTDEFHAIALEFSDEPAGEN